MKRLSVISILLLVYSSLLHAQTTDSWVGVPLEDDQLTIQMPKSQKLKIQDFRFERFKVDGHVYTATEDGVDYYVWSLVDKGDAKENRPPDLSYLDYCADLVWESFLKPLRDQLPEEAKVQSRMSYAGTLNWTSLRVNSVWYQPQGREYSIRLGNRTGKAQFYVAGPQIYILVVLNEDAKSAAAQRFVDSFRVKKEVDPKLIPLGSGGGIGPGEGSGLGPGRGGNIGGSGPNAVGGGGPGASGSGTDYNRVFNGREVNQKARITSKPEPTYTESARKYAVAGTVVIRAVFSRSGEVTPIRVVSWLPHGLTAKAVNAAKQIKFTPALKDGQPVSMWFQLEYNFNLY